MQIILVLNIYNETDLLRIKCFMYHAIKYIIKMRDLNDLCWRFLLFNESFVKFNSITMIKHEYKFKRFIF